MAFITFLVSGLSSVAGLCFLLLISSSASAATLNVSGGQLLGASGVIVDGSSYNVEFLDSTCIALFSGCDAVSDFTFQSEAAALLASQALLDQVFLDGVDLFDTAPALTAGCSGGQECRAWTPYAPPTPAFSFVAAVASQNFPGLDADATPSAYNRPAADATISTDDVYAVWAPIPEPGTGILMGLGLLAMSVRSRRES